MMIDLFLFSKKKSDHRKSEKKFKEGFVGQVVFAFKKKGKFDLVRKNTFFFKKKNHQKRDETKKTIEPKKFYREITNSKMSDFSTKTKNK